MTPKRPPRTFTFNDNPTVLFEAADPQVEALRRERDEFREMALRWGRESDALIASIADSVLIDFWMVLIGIGSFFVNPGPPAAVSIAWTGLAAVATGLRIWTLVKAKRGEMGS